MNRPPIAALERLGVAQDADERAIKRAYAGLLKLHRPDTDPSGFQALNEAYQQALSWLRQPVAFAETNEPVTAVEQAAMPVEAPSALPDAAGGVPVHPAAPHAPSLHDPGALALEVLRHAIDDAPAALRLWLEQNPALWSLSDKVHVGRALFDVLEQGHHCIENARFDVLQRFFSWDSLDGDVDPFQLEDVRHKAHIAWKLISQEPSNAHVWRLQNDLQHLSRPFKWRTALFNALPIGEADRICGLLDVALRVPEGTPVPPVVERNRAFWRAAADPSRFTFDRMMVYAARCLLITAIFSTIVVPILVIRAAPSTFWGAVLHAGLAWMYVSAAVVGCAVAVGLCQWQLLPDTALRHGRWAHRLCIPILSAATLLLADRLWWPIAWALAITLLIAACIRGFYRHYVNPFHQPVWRAAPLLLLVCFVSVNSRVIGIPLVFALLYWLLDACRQVLRQRKRAAGQRRGASG
ncbi:J domain-containing protein [Xanthomonas sp. AmX2]|uniref:J domain-containing protein n=1 Tax=Xanthomonas sp. TaxID=29446 RepID=UPI00197EF599|nr:J domain-containing protein [Xanthomonas sp.]MBN6152697.1 J domain-containing protein [Xanthomonas sp.]